MGDTSPAFSPDGARLAFVRDSSRTWGDRDIWVQLAAGGEARQLTFGHHWSCCSLAWTPNGDEIVFSTGAEASGDRLYRVSVEGGPPRPVAGIGEGMGWASVGKDRMVYVQFGQRPDLDILRISGRRGAASRPVPEVLISSSELDGEPAYSPDGRRILFDSRESGSYDLYTVDARGGVPRRLTHESSDENAGTYSPDGAWIYFSSNRAGRRQIWKMPAEGGEAVQVTREGGFYAEASRNGRDVYFCRSVTDGTVWRVPAEGGKETEVLRGPNSKDHWTLSERGIYFTTWAWGLRHRSARYTIQYLDLGSGEVTELFSKEGSARPQCLAVSPDEQWILYTEVGMLSSELKLVENFR
jgi:Tol biopolymer transport system component